MVRVSDVIFNGNIFEDLSETSERCWLCLNVVAVMFANLNISHALHSFMNLLVHLLLLVWIYFRKRTRICLRLNVNMVKSVTPAAPYAPRWSFEPGAQGYVSPRKCEAPAHGGVLLRDRT